MIKKIIINIYYLVLITIFSQIMLGALFVLGWSFQLMRQKTIKFLNDLADTKIETNYKKPILFLKDEGQWGLIKNIKIGFTVLLHTTILLAPGIILWMYAWYAGWQISFHKAYEYSKIGSSLGVIGVLYFSIIMLYIPMAQARYAFTLNWKTFYQFKSNKNLIFSNIGKLVITALLFSLFAIFVNFFKTLPIFIHNIFPNTETMNDQELLVFLRNYYFITAIPLLILFLILKKHQAKVYAKSLVLSVQSQIIDKSDLFEAEWSELESKGLNILKPKDQINPYWQLIKRNTARLFKVKILLLSFLLWLFFCFQIFASEFLNYHNNQGWLNQPHIQLPYFKYIPDHLTEPEAEDPLVTDPNEMKETHPILK